MRTIFRNADNRAIFKLRDDPAGIADAAVLFRQGGRIVLHKGKGKICIREKADEHGAPFWEASVKLTPEESCRFDARGIGFAQIVLLRENGVQENGEILEFEVCDTVAEQVRFSPANRKKWKNESMEEET